MKYFEYEVTVENGIGFNNFKNQSSIVWANSSMGSYWINMFTYDFTQEKVSFHSKLRIHEL